MVDFVMLDRPLAFFLLLADVFIPEKAFDNIAIAAAGMHFIAVLQVESILVIPQIVKAVDIMSIDQQGAVNAQVVPGIDLLQHRLHSLPDKVVAILQVDLVVIATCLDVVYVVDAQMVFKAFSIHSYEAGLLIRLPPLVIF